MDYAIALVILLAAPLAAQGRSLNDSATSLNRSGQWAAAAALAQSGLQQETNPTVRCDLLTSLAYASVRIARHSAALESARPAAALHVAEAEKGCANTAREGTWQLKALRGELDSLGTSETAPITKHADDDGFWRTGDALAQGIDPAVLAEHLKLCQETGADACLVARHGVIVQEWYSTRYREPMLAMSSTKSVAGLLTGMLIGDGTIARIDDPVCRYLADWCQGMRGRVTLRHLLTMTSGLPMMQDSGIGNRGAKNAFVRALQPTSEPGSTWAYSNEGVQLLEPILTRAAGEPIQAYAQRRLFDAIGMRNSRLHVYHEAWLYADMETTLRDFARIGVLALHHGMWQGKQVVPAAWMDSSVVPSQRLNSSYGLLWWLDAGSKSYLTEGHLDTDVRVVPDLDLIVVRMQSKAVPGTPPEGTYRQQSAELVPRMVRE